MDIFSTAVLNRVVSDLRQPSSFLLDTFFPDVQTEDSEEIHFDIDKSKPRLAPFVSPLVAGKLVADDGFETKSFRPAYVKDKRRFNPDQPLKRKIGETIGGNLTPMNRREASLNRSLNNQLHNLTRTEELMAAQALTTGRVTVQGEHYPTTVVDFQRDPELTQALTGANRWGETGIDVLSDIEDWADLVQNHSGAAGNNIVMDPMVWRLFRSNPRVEKFLEIRRGTNNSLNIDPMARGQGNDKARYVGTIGDFDFWVYNDVYVDPVTGNTERLLQPNTVIMASRALLEGTRCYGVIQDEKANYKASRFFTKSWLEEDPAVRWLLMQSAPLVVPYRPNASFCATVR